MAHSGVPKQEIAVALDFCVPENRQIEVNHKGKDVLRTVVRRLYSDMYGLQGVWRCLRKVRIEKSARICVCLYTCECVGAVPENRQISSTVNRSR